MPNVSEILFVRLFFGNMLCAYYVSCQNKDVLKIKKEIMSLAIGVR